MNYSELSRPAQYAVVFVLSGLVAVLVKLAADMEENRIAGLVAMMPTKILIAWMIVGAAAGSRGVAESTSGMFMGLAALLAAIGAVRVLSPHLGPALLIASGLGVWLATATLLEWLLRPVADGS